MYADKGYPWTQFISIGWPQPRATPNAAQSAFQRDMSRYRSAVEWGFAHDVTALFRFIDDVSEQKILLHSARQPHVPRCNFPQELPHLHQSEQHNSAVFRVRPARA